MSERDPIRDKIAEQENLLADLERQQAEVRTELSTLKAQLRPTGLVSEPSAVPAAVPMTPAGKVALFRRLFRGRDDIFPKLWVNARNGKKGYAPACSNEWVRSVCEKPKIKCGECPNQAFIPVADQVIVDHLQGRHVIGVCAPS